MAKKQCSRCHETKRLSEFSKRNVLMKAKSEPYLKEHHIAWCKSCMRNYSREKYGYMDRNEMFRQRRLGLWGDVCEMWVNSPEMTLEDIANHFGIHYAHVSYIITRYLGDGKPVLMQISLDD